jgi:hypothetical protein
MSRIWIVLILFLVSSANANPVIPSLSLDKNGLYSIQEIELNNSDLKANRLTILKFKKAIATLILVIIIRWRYLYQA